MAKQVMRRHASDNAYLHKDFHGALSAGIEYLHRRYGAGAVRDYLRQFARAFYAPLRAEVRRRGLPALRAHFERIYRAEGGRLRISMSRDELRLEVPFSPAVRHMRAHKYRVARLFGETVRTVHETICEGTPFTFELCAYDRRTGRSVQRFTRRAP